MTAPKSLAGFYGKKTRQQEILTPPIILEAILQVWGHIEHDPCPSPGSPATIVAKTSSTDGLKKIWPFCTYANPPFDSLGKWMAHAEHSAMDGGINGPREIMILAPVRTHRNHWCRIAARSTRIAWLRPVTFVGYPNAFPAPLAMLYWGNCGNSFARAFEPLAHHIGCGI